MILFSEQHKYYKLVSMPISKPLGLYVTMKQRSIMLFGILENITSKISYSYSIMLPGIVESANTNVTQRMIYLDFIFPVPMSWKSGSMTFNHHWEVSDSECFNQRIIFGKNKLG